MKYTTSGKADKKIEEDMEIICKEIREKIPNVLSIILTGGFSRGEGSVKEINGKFYPYNDYDIQVISKKQLSKEKTDNISVDISRKLGYKGIINFYPFKKEEQKIKENFYVDLKYNNASDLKKLLPRVRTYELKNNSMLLYGKDMRNLIPDCKLEEIPLSEGAKLLLDRMSQMIEYYSTEKKYDGEFLEYIIQQTYAACCTSLLLLSKKYEIGYEKSMKILKQTYRKDFPELYKKIPNLDKKIEEFVSWRINPNKPKFKDVKKEWFIAKDNVLEVSKYFFSKFLKKEIRSLEDLSQEILNMRKEFYNPYLKKIIPIKILHKITIPIARLIVLLLLNRKYNKRLKRAGIKFKSKSLSPDLIIFSSLIYIISSINKERINEDLLNKGKRLLERVYPSKGKSWEEISTDYANAYIAFFLQKI